MAVATEHLENLNVASLTPLVAPAELQARLPLAPAAAHFVATTRAAVAAIVQGRDRRFLVVVGPCSIHDLAAARDYLARLAPLARRYADRLLVLMRVYFEKPRTTVGWKGFINDPHLDDSFDIAAGLALARGFLLELAAVGMPAATEALDPIVPQYLGDLVSWYAIGARTTESQTHREMASGLSALRLQERHGWRDRVALQACRRRVRRITSSASIATDALPSSVPAAIGPHIILRGGRTPNYAPEVVSACVDALRAAGLPPAVMVDCSHGNSGKDPWRQPDVARAVLGQRVAGQRALVGLMLESHLEGGRQDLGADPGALRYGVSITDACLDWTATAALLDEIHGALAAG